MPLLAYRCNRACRCARCRARGLMAPAILITIGLVFLSDRAGILLVPAVLIVIGVVQLLRANAPTDGHLDPYVPPAQPGTPAVPAGFQEPPANFNPPSPAPTTASDYGKEDQHG